MIQRFARFGLALVFGIVSSSSCTSSSDPDASGGTCSVPCNDVNGLASCEGGECVVACFAGFADCDADPATGCEVDLGSDPAHCGTCTDACNFEGGEARCTDGACELDACSSGRGDCDADSTNGCEVNTQTDADNCSACGRSCGGGACHSGTCSAAPERIFKGGASELVVDDEFVYFTNGYGLEPNQGVVLKVSKNAKRATEAEYIADGQDKPWDIVLDGGALYWANIGAFDRSDPNPPFGSITRRAPGGQPEVIVDDVDGPHQLMVDATHVYWLTNTGSLQRAPKLGGALAELGFGSAIALSGSMLIGATNVAYVGDEYKPRSDFWSMPKAGGVAAPLGSLEGYSVNRVASNGTTLYFTAYSPTATLPSLVGALPLSGGEIAIVAEGETTTFAYALALDASALYFTNLDGRTPGSVVKVPLPAGPPQLLAAAQADPRAITVDATHVYFQSSAGLFKVAK